MTTERSSSRGISHFQHTLVSSAFGEFPGMLSNPWAHSNHFMALTESFKSLT
jgi:hypothetical protein